MVVWRVWYISIISHLPVMFLIGAIFSQRNPTSQFVPYHFGYLATNAN